MGSLEAGKRADVVLVKNGHSPVMFPLLNPYGHVALQAQRGDVHTVMAGGRLVEHEHRLIGVDLAKVRRTVDSTVEHLRSRLGAEVPDQGMNPDVPETKVLDNPYTYTGYRTAATHGGRPGDWPGARAAAAPGAAASLYAAVRVSRVFTRPRVRSKRVSTRYSTAAPSITQASRCSPPVSACCPKEAAVAAEATIEPM